MVSAVILPNPKAAFITSAGAPAAGYKVYTYDAGTLTPRTTYLDAAGGASNTNPIILDARGEAVIYWDGSYKVVLKDAADVPVWTVDNFRNATAPLTLNSANGLVGINMTPVNVLDITQNVAGTAKVSLVNTNAGAASQAIFAANNGSGNAVFGQLGTGYTTSGIYHADATYVQGGGAGGLILTTSAAQPVYFGINGTEAGEFTTAKYFKASNDGTYFAGVGSTYHELRQTAAASYTAVIANAHASTPFGLTVTYSGAAPNGTSNEFLNCTDSGATRATIRSNGGLANFSANNVNLSDIRVKPAFELLDDSGLDALQASFVAIDFARFKYDGQSHDDWNYGYSAQGIEAAFALTVPAMTDVWNPTTTVEADDGTGKMVQQKIPTPAKDQLKAVYTEDLHNIAHALLARALKRIAVLEARLAAAGVP